MISLCTSCIKIKIEFLKTIILLLLEYVLEPVETK